MTTAERLVIMPTAGKVVFDTDIGVPFYGNGSTWYRQPGRSIERIPMVKNLVVGDDNIVSSSYGMFQFDWTEFGADRQFRFYAIGEVGGPDVGSITLWAILKSNKGIGMGPLTISYVTFTLAGAEFKTYANAVTPYSLSLTAGIDKILFVATDFVFVGPGAMPPGDFGIVHEAGIQVE